MLQIFHNLPVEAGFFILFYKIDDCVSSWVLYLTFKQFLLPKCMPQSLACALLWLSPAVVHASLTSSIALELFSPMSLLSMLEVMRTSCCGHSGRQTLLPCDLGQVFKTAWHIVSQGKLIKTKTKNPKQKTKPPPTSENVVWCRCLRRHWGLCKM